MNGEVLSVGTELLMGQIANTNAQYISAQMPEAGVDIYYHSVVGDNPKRLEKMLLHSLGRSDVIIMTGGLGPTKDDLTKETVCGILNINLVLDEKYLKKMQDFFKERNRIMSPNNEKQAYIPEGCICIENGKGTAPGYIIEQNGKYVILLPGPPNEMIPMLKNSILPFFKAKTKTRLYSKYIRVFGLGESSAEYQLLDLINAQANPTIATYAKPGQLTIRVTCSYNDENEIDNILNPVLNEIKRRIGEYIYSFDNEELCQSAAKLLIEKNMTISSAESCTGGLIASSFIEIPGVSKVFERGFVTYSNRSKTEELDVDPETIEKYGAVSRETAVEMAVGAKKASGTDISVSVTGIAGPSGGTKEKPVGLVYAAIDYFDEINVRKLDLYGSRERIRQVAALNVFDMIRRKILGMNI